MTDDLLFSSKIKICISRYNFHLHFMVYVGQAWLTQIKSKVDLVRLIEPCTRKFDSIKFHWNLRFSEQPNSYDQELGWLRKAELRILSKKLAEKKLDIFVPNKKFWLAISYDERDNFLNIRGRNHFKIIFKNWKFSVFLIPLWNLIAYEYSTSTLRDETEGKGVKASIIR